ncbi:hypothetical protein WUBG_06525 [Wuchereria bancrofti]|uniref:Uncharacterized protein n=1 Tax=Wuchereria bancrofti TaxID=6293 RepID=J9EJG9_WUCBA|nr:hypothetical protein WUBG_06525 [Wuchereria bancrofti]
MEVATAKSKTSTTTSSKPFGKTSKTKGLKLQRPFLKSTGEDDLNCLLGIKSSADGNEVTNRNTFAVKNSSDILTDGWGDNFTTSGWDDFDVSSGGTSIKVVEDGEWNISWNADEPVEISSVSESKEVHQSKIATRNKKAHNMEMARKRTVRGTGATRVISDNDESIH